MAPRWVKKRDGRIEPFDPSRIARAVSRAGRRAGSTEEVERLAREITTSVTLFLTRENERAPETAHIAEAMESALERTGHGQISRSVRDWRDWRRRRQAEVRVRETGDDRVEVLSLRAARPWSKPRIVRALESDAGLEREAAEEVARAVEERVFAAGLNRISSTLLRELIDAELFERGYSAQLGRMEVLGVPKPELERLVYLGQGRAPLSLEDRVARAALERYALDEVVEGRGAVAHRRGDIHLVGLGRPFRMASGAVDARSVAHTPAAPARPLEAVRRLMQVARGAMASNELMFGLVGVERAFAPWLEQGDAEACEEAIELLLEASCAPCPDDLPPAPELVLAVDAPPGLDAERRALLLLLEALRRRGGQGAGVRLALRVSTLEELSDPLVLDVARAAHDGASVDLVLGEGPGLCSRGMLPWAGTMQVGLLNLAGLALSAGRGQRERFGARLAGAVEAALEAFHKRRRRVFASVVRPEFPLFGKAPDEPHPPAIRPEALGEALGVVGLDAAMRYLTGEGPAENPRVAELAREVLVEVRVALDAVASRLGLGRVLLEDVPAGDAGIRLAALDLDRFEDARPLLGSAAGWDTGVALRPEVEPMLADLRARLWLGRKTKCPLVLARPLVAAVEPERLVEAVRAGLERSTGRAAT